MDDYSNDVYPGGLTDYPAANLFPKASSEGEDTGVPGQGGMGRINPTNGGPATMNGSYQNQFVDDSSYCGDMSVDNDPKMVVRNPDSISKSGTGKMP